jgi:uncharacterized membrane protein
MKRFWEIDFSRGFAVVLMIIFNYSFALSYLKIFTLDWGLLYWYVFPRIGASLFIFISGLSMSLVYNSKRKDYHRRITSRGLEIFCFGLLITAVTFFTFPEAFVLFGTLHLIGFSMIFGQPFLKHKKLTPALGALIILFGLHLQNFSFDFPWLIPLGFMPNNYFTFDYFPILPWFGVTLLGMSLGDLLYKNGKRNFRIKDLSNTSLVKFLTFLGRNSLIIYLIHQPLLVLLLLILGFKVF